MPETKHYVYSARTTEKGLALLNKAKVDMGWGSFINEAVAAHYGLDAGVINLPPSKFLAEREERCKAKEAEKAKKTEKKGDGKDGKQSLAPRAGLEPAT